MTGRKLRLMTLIDELSIATPNFSTMMLLPPA
jgi:hypothetical protein